MRGHRIIAVDANPEGQPLRHRDAAAQQKPAGGKPAPPGRRGCNYKPAAMDDAQQIQEEETANRQLRLEIDSLKTDPKSVERLAREQLGLARPDETVVRFETPGE